MFVYCKIKGGSTYDFDHSRATIVGLPFAK